ncbi:hypothetical protein KUF71_002565, partial [Frankliniella fusca]
MELLFLSYLLGASSVRRLALGKRQTNNSSPLTKNLLMTNAGEIPWKDFCNKRIFDLDGPPQVRAVVGAAEGADVFCIAPCQSSGFGGSNAVFPIVGYLGVTAHWLHRDTLERRSAALACRRINGSQTYNVLATLLSDIFEKYGIKEKISSLTAEDSENDEDDSDAVETQAQEATRPEMHSMSNIFGREELAGDISLPPHRRCACHLLNQMATTGLSKALERAEAVTKYKALEMVFQAHRWSRILWLLASTKVFRTTGYNIASTSSSSTYPLIRAKCDYGRQVIKLHCANHLIVRLSDHLHGLLEKTKEYPVESRILLKSELLCETPEEAAKGAVHRGVTWPDRHYGYPEARFTTEERLAFHPDLSDEALEEAKKCEPARLAASMILDTFFMIETIPDPLSGLFGFVISNVLLVSLLHGFPLFLGVMCDMGCKSPQTIRRLWRESRWTMSGSVYFWRSMTVPLLPEDDLIVSEISERTSALPRKFSCSEDRFKGDKSREKLRRIGHRSKLA